MKKVIIATVLAGFISLGFKISNKATENQVVTKTQSLPKADNSSVVEKRLASWD